MPRIGKPVRRDDDDDAKLTGLQRWGAIGGILAGMAALATIAVVSIGFLVGGKKDEKKKDEAPPAEKNIEASHIELKTGRLYKYIGGLNDKDQGAAKDASEDLLGVRFPASAKLFSESVQKTYGEDFSRFLKELQEKVGPTHPLKDFGRVTPPVEPKKDAVPTTPKKDVIPAEKKDILPDPADAGKVTVLVVQEHTPGKTLKLETTKLTPPTETRDSGNTEVDGKGLLVIKGGKDTNFVELQNNGSVRLTTTPVNVGTDKKPQYKVTQENPVFDTPDGYLGICAHPEAGKFVQTPLVITDITGLAAGKKGVYMPFCQPTIKAKDKEDNEVDVARKIILTGHTGQFHDLLKSGRMPSIEKDGVVTISTNETSQNLAIPGGLNVEATLNASPVYITRFAGFGVDPNTGLPGPIYVTMPVAANLNLNVTQHIKQAGVDVVTAKTPFGSRSTDNSYFNAVESTSPPTIGPKGEGQVIGGIHFKEKGFFIIQGTTIVTTVGEARKNGVYNGPPGLANNQKWAVNNPLVLAVGYVFDEKTKQWREPQKGEVPPTADDNKKAFEAWKKRQINQTLEVSAIEGILNKDRALASNAEQRKESALSLAMNVQMNGAPGFVSLESGLMVPGAVATEIAADKSAQEQLFARVAAEEKDLTSTTVMKYFVSNPGQKREIEQEFRGDDEATRKALRLAVARAIVDGKCLSDGSRNPEYRGEGMGVA